MSFERGTRGRSEGDGQAAESAAGKRTRTQSLVQRRAAGGTRTDDVQGAAAAGVGGAGERLPFLDQIQASFGGHDVSEVGAHTGGEAADAARSIGAEAYAMGDQVAFGRSPDLHTAAHEAAHVVQQRGGVQLKGGVGEDGDAHERHADAVADRVVAGQGAADLLDHYGSGGGGGAPGVQMRRLPANVASILTDPAGGPAANFDAHAEGLIRLLERSLQDVTDPAELAAIRTEMFGGMGFWDFLSLPQEEILTRVTNAVQKVRPDLTLGDPAGYKTGARTGTDDEKNIKKLVKNATRRINQCIDGSHDTSLRQVFGASHMERARRRYEAGRNWMRRLAREDEVVTDRSGYTDEAGIGGLTATHVRIMVAPEVIDNPDDALSVVIMIHEAMHSGTEAIEDKGYIGTDGFDTLPADVKVTNAAHYEVVPRRILALEPTYAGVTFRPAGTGSGAAATPDTTDGQKALRSASEAMRSAWTAAIRIHNRIIKLNLNPTLWTSDPDYAAAIPFWSKVEALTIHKKTDVDPTSASAGKHPCSLIDVALSEGLVRRLGQGMNVVPEDEAGLTAFEAANADAAAIAAAGASVAGHADFIISLIVGSDGVAPITGDVARDLRVVRALSAAVDDVMTARNPDDFAD